MIDSKTKNIIVIRDHAETAFVELTTILILSSFTKDLLSKEERQALIQAQQILRRTADIPIPGETK